MSNPEFWRGLRVLVTGQTGFKGAWLCLWLEQLGAKVSAFALPPRTQPSLYELAGPWTGQDHAITDLADRGAVLRAIETAKPQIVFHLAAQALVRASYRDPVGTFATNVMGTLHVLDACRSVPGVEAVVVVTTDKVYENLGAEQPFHETDRLGGKDPYSSSKACAELAVVSFRDSFLARDRPPFLATVRAGNVVGGGDWSQDRLIPDVVRALTAGQKVALRYPHAVRPWQHVLEPLRGYLMLAERLATWPSDAPSAVNFGPDPDSFLTVAEVVDILKTAFPDAKGWEQAPGDHAAEAKTLTLSSHLAEKRLGWRPRLSMAQTIRWTADWYRLQARGASARTLCLEQISDYQALCSWEARAT